MIRRMYRKGATDIWCIHKEGKFAGLAITINGPDKILLDYFAVSTAVRGQGIGTMALLALNEKYAPKGLFVEIESTQEPSENPEQRMRRKRFYLACGMQELGVNALLFGVRMELLGWRCQMDYADYKAFYHDCYNPWAADHINP